MIWGGLRRVKLKIVVKKDSKSRERRFLENHVQTMLSGVLSKSCCRVGGFFFFLVKKRVNRENANKENLRLEICLM